ncbi:hypothetical protein QOT17_015820 [Balamuthia mandrillaris]
MLNMEEVLCYKHPLPSCNLEPKWESVRAHIPLPSLDDYANFTAKLVDAQPELLHFADAYFDSEGHALLLGDQDWPHGRRWLYHRVINGKPETEATWTLRSCKTDQEGNISYEDICGEEPILGALFPDKAQRPPNIMDSDSFHLYAYVRCVRATYSLEDGCQVHLDFVHLGPDKYLLLATIIAPNLQALRSTKDRLVGSEAITVPTQSEVVCRIKHTSPELYRRLVDRGVVPKLPYWEGNVLSKLPPGIDLGVPCPLECQVQMEKEELEKSAAEPEVFYT